MEVTFEPVVQVATRPSGVERRSTLVALSDWGSWVLTHLPAILVE